MILFVCRDKSRITDFIMWADVEFAMQIEILEMKKFEDQAASIIDLNNLSSLGSIVANEPLFVLCHGSPGSQYTSLQGERYKWDALGGAIGKALSVNCKRIVLFACYAAAGDMGKRPIDLFVKGLSAHRKGVVVEAYQGATVTNTMNTIAARDAGGGSSDPVFTLDDSTNWDMEQEKLIKQHGPQLKFGSYLQSHTNATDRAKAINAARSTEDFYFAYGSEMQKQKRFYPVGIGLGATVKLISTS